MMRIVCKISEELASMPGSPEIISANSIFRGTDLKADKRNIRLNKLFTSLNEEQLAKLNRRAITMDRSYTPINFSGYYYLDGDIDADPVEILQALRNNSDISWAYLDESMAIPPHNYSLGKPLACFQGYLYDAPGGIGASHAWKRKGGRGDASVKFVDVEQGWLFAHESLDLQKIPNSGINHAAFSEHGAAVMGIIMMRDGGSGGIGITPMVKGSVMSLFRPDGMLNTPDAIVSALPYLEEGDILLLETQILDTENRYDLWPVEIHNANFDIIRLATAMGITVIEPCGNGNSRSSAGNNLDEYKNQEGIKIFDRNDRGFRDSGAIMVAAATSDIPHRKMHYSNYGNRIDCYSWGENIVTAGLHPYSSGIAINTYTHQFGGSSGAAAIITGVAISLQSMMDANYQCRLDSLQMRNILGSPLYGTISAGGIDDGIGIMPDLQRITRDFVDKFEESENVIPNKGHNIRIAQYDQAI